MQWEQSLCLSPEADSQMFTSTLDTADLAIKLLILYSFDLSGYSAFELVDRWQQEYSGSWLHLAVIEALYQGRYKAVSVQQILKLWQRRGQAIFHFNMEFERLICSKFPQNLTSLPPPTLPEQKLRNEDTRTRGHSSGEKEDTMSLKKSQSHRVSPTDTLTPVAQQRHASVPLQSGKSSPVALNEVTRAKNWRTTAQPDSTEENNRLGELPTPVRQESLQRSYSTQVSSKNRSLMPEQLASLFPVATNHPPIGQFTPQKSDRSDSFTSKLKAIALEDGVKIIRNW